MNKFEVKMLTGQSVFVVADRIEYDEQAGDYTFYDTEDGIVAILPRETFGYILNLG